MVEFRILTAVFVTLLATAVAMNSGFQLPELGGIDFERPGLEDTTGAFSYILPAESGEVELEAELEFSEENSVEFEADSVALRNLTQIEVGEMTLESAEPVVFKNFDGSVSYANNTTVEGQAGGVYSQSFEISGDFSVQESDNVEEVRKEGTETGDVSLDVNGGEINTDVGSTDITESTSVKMSSFEGKINVYPNEGRITLEGVATGLTAGDISFG